MIDDQPNKLRLLMMEMLSKALSIPWSRIERAIACYDPLRWDLREGPHEEWGRIEIGGGYTFLKVVPGPYAAIDVFETWWEFLRDRCTAMFVLEHDFGWEEACGLAVNQWEWVRLWAERHSDGDLRRAFAALRSELDGLAEQAAAEVTAYYRKQNILLFKRRRAS
jgi:hypothetical protein